MQTPERKYHFHDFFPAPNCNTFRESKGVLFAHYCLIFIYLYMQHEKRKVLQLGSVNTNATHIFIDLE